MYYAAMRSGVVAVAGVGYGDSDGDESDSDPGIDLTATRGLADHRLECVAANPDRPSRAFCGTFDDGLYRTTDAGETWHRTGLSAESVTSLAIRPDDPDIVFAGTEPSRLYRSTDGGETWYRRDGLRDLASEPSWSFPPRPQTDHVRWVEPDPEKPDHLYVGVEAGALVTTPDGGETYRDRVEGGPRDTHTVATHPAAPDRAWVAAGDGFYVTSDRGDTWTTVESGLDRTYCWSVAVGGDGTPETALVSAARGAGSAHRQPAETYVYRRDLVAGDEWERIDGTALPTGEGVLRPVLEGDPEASGEFVAATDRGLYRTTDGGDTWRRLPVDWDAYTDETARGLAVV
ncbi:MAG: WD40/YVTN/BNR-like repeat-containing protein [Halolamina sp.]